MSRPDFETLHLEEYKAGEHARVKEDRLSVEGLYTVMFALEPYRSRREALKCPGEVVDIDMHDNGIFYMVRFNLLDSSGQPANHRNDVFHDGYLLAKGKGDSNEFANVGYFREDGEGLAGREPQTAAAADEAGLRAVPEYEPVAA